MNIAVSNRLNLIRITAAWFVLLGHGLSLCSLTVFRNDAVFPYMQNIGVVLLFFISGFLNTHSNERKKVRMGGGGQYLANRFCRIFPPYLAALILVAALDMLFVCLKPQNYIYYNAFNVKTFAGNMLMLQDMPYYTVVTSFGSARPFWTLAIEWWIYAAWGWWYWKVWKKIKNRENINFFGLIAGTCLGFIPLYNLLGGRGLGLTFVWAAGAGSYYLYNKINWGRAGVRKICLWLWALLTAACGYVTKNAYSLPFYMCLIIFLILFFNDASLKQNDKASKNRVLEFLSGYTYSLYLVHYSIFIFILYNTQLTPSRKFLAGVVASNVIAILLYFFIEKNSKKIYIILNRKKDEWKGIRWINRK